MSQEPTTPDLALLVQRKVDAVNARDFDAAMSFYAPDAVYDSSPMGMGRFEGSAAIRRLFEEWWGAYEQSKFALEETRDLGEGHCVLHIRYAWPPPRCHWLGATPLRIRREVPRRSRGADHELHRHRPSPCCRRTPRRGPGVGDVGEPGPGRGEHVRLSATSSLYAAISRPSTRATSRQPSRFAIPASSTTPFSQGL
jgi:SnoaL-like domain